LAGEFLTFAFTLLNSLFVSNKIDEKNLSDLSDHIFEAKLNG